MRRPPKYCHHKQDRHGGAGFWYFERRGFPRARLPGLPWSPEFMAAYQDAMKGSPVPIGAKGIASRSVDDLATRYLQSPAFLLKCRPGTQEKYRRVIDRIRAEHGHRLAVDLTRGKVFELLQRFVDRPSQGNLWLKVISNMFGHAVKLEWIKENPCRGVEKLPERGRETQPWTSEQMKRFRVRWPVGTMQRLAFELLLWTGRRLSDVRLIGPQHVEYRDGSPFIAFRQVKAKTDEKLYSLLVAELLSAINATPQRGLVYVTTEAGSRFASDKSFGNFMNKAIRAAGIEGVTAHGLRATIATAVAESLGTGHEIKAVTGHKRDSMVEKYTRRANQPRLAKSAMSKVVPILGNKPRTGE